MGFPFFVYLRLYEIDFYCNIIVQTPLVMKRGGYVMLYRLCSLIFIFFLFWEIQDASACSPKPWSYELLAQESTAVVYGEVVDSSMDGRQAVVKVVHYVGPADLAPKIIHLPATESSQKTAEDECPDFSTKFEQGKWYIIFLKNTGSTPELLYTNWITALMADDNHVMVNIQGNKEEISAVIQKYAEDRQQTVQTPDQTAPVWGATKSSTTRFSAASILSIIVISVCIYYFVKSRRRL